MQLHPGWVGLLQRRYLNALGCLWFNRTQAQDRSLVAQRMKDHVHSAGRLACMRACCCVSTCMSGPALAA